MKLIPPSPYVGPGNQTQFTRLGCNHLYPLSHLATEATITIPFPLLLLSLFFLIFILIDFLKEHRFVESLYLNLLKLVVSYLIAYFLTFLPSLFIFPCWPQIYCVMRRTLNSLFSCLYLPGARVKGVHYHAWLVQYWGLNPGLCEC